MNLGRQLDGTLTPCPKSPNCVCSTAEDEGHRIAPLTLPTGMTNAVDELERIVLSMPRTKIVSKDGNYLRAEFTSALFRFVDDVEFSVLPEAGIVHVRSASRIGRSDLGANRKRIEAIRARFGSQ